jgi:hypothetical protein
MNLVIDSCVFINYGLYNKLYRLADAIIKYDLKVFVDHDLLLEIERNLNKSKIRSIEEVNKTMNDISYASYILIIVMC